MKTHATSRKVANKRARSKARPKNRHAWDLLTEGQRCRKCKMHVKYLRGGPKGGAVLSICFPPTRGFIQMESIPECSA